MTQGYWIPVLHSHLPFVKHPEYEYFLEEQWLFEAIDECYIPLLKNLKKLVDEDIDFRLTTSVTPPLAEMLKDELLMQKYGRHLNTMIELGNREIERTKSTNQEEQRLAHFYRDRYIWIKEFFEGFLEGNVLNGYKHFAQLGKLEIITCGATHGYLPILSVNEKAVEAQISIAVESHKENFGVYPNGIWLPECAYFDGLDKVLAKYGIKFFFGDSHTLICANPTAQNSVFSPIYTPENVAVFSRDPQSSKKVWSSKEGYPGDFNYRDFYRDIGYDLDYEYIKDFISPDGTRVFTGFKYRKVTGDTDDKGFYNPEIAYEKTKEHAQNFAYERVLQLQELSPQMDRPPMLVSPYDAELFGHWWFEGTDFLYHLFKEIDKQKSFTIATPMEYLKQNPTNQVTIPTPSSWGDEGYYAVWLNKENDWIYRHLHFMADAMQELATRHQDEKDPIKVRILNQLLRELLLGQSSDWAFLITTETAIEYSERRTKEHIHNFLELSKMLVDEVDLHLLEWLEQKNSIFQGVDFRVFAD
jgi:1,4-alpha-glucan branching enzyme